MNIYRKEDYNNWIQHLETEGYVIIQDILSPNERNILLNKFEVSYMKDAEIKPSRRHWFFCAETIK